MNIQIYTEKLNFEIDKENIPFESESYRIPLVKSITKKNFIVGRNKVNLRYLQCSCGNYRANVKYYPKRDIRRICKHIYTVFSNEGSKYYDQLSKNLLDAKFWFGQKYVYKSLIEDVEVFIGFDKKFAKTIIHLLDEEWRRYMFSFKDKIWLEDKVPSNYELILEKVITIRNYCIGSEVKI